MDGTGAVSVAEAAEICKVSDDTIRRRLWDGSLPGARREYQPNGPWRIPLTDLVAAGLRPQLSGLTQSEASEQIPPRKAWTGARLSSEEAERMRSDLLELTARTARAEALAEARREHATALLSLLTDVLVDRSIPASSASLATIDEEAQ